MASESWIIRLNAAKGKAFKEFDEADDKAADD
jgi:hypothetical protein